MTSLTQGQYFTDFHQKENFSVPEEDLAVLDLLNYEFNVSLKCGPKQILRGNFEFIQFLTTSLVKFDSTVTFEVIMLLLSIIFILIIFQEIEKMISL